MANRHEPALPEFEPLLAGTVALMTCFPDQSEDYVARKIANNLLMLSRHPRCDSDRLRRVLLRARDHWAQRTLNVDPARRAGAGPEPGAGVERRRRERRAA